MIVSAEPGSFGFTPGSGSATLNSRAMTRSTLPSSTVAFPGGESDGGDRRGGVSPNAWKLPQLLFIFIGEPAAILLRNSLGAFVQVTSPRVIAKPGPGMKRGRQIGRRQI